MDVQFPNEHSYRYWKNVHHGILVMTEQTNWLRSQGLSLKLRLISI